MGCFSVVVCCGINCEKELLELARNIAKILTMIVMKVEIVTTKLMMKLKLFLKQMKVNINREEAKVRIATWKTTRFKQLIFPST